MKATNRFPRRFIPLVTCLALGLGCGLPAYAESKLPSGVTATVNGAAVSSSFYEQIVKANIAQGAKDTPEMRQAIKEELIAREVLAQASIRLGLDKTPQAMDQLALIRQNYLVDLLLKEHAEKNPVADAAIQAEYERQVKVLNEMKDLLQYKVSLIALTSEAEAHSVLVSLHKGVSFEKLARGKSIDASKTAGGSLGWLLPDQIVPVISNEMVKLAKGAVVSSPIQTPAGWQVVKLEDKRPYKIPSLEESKNLVRQGLEQQQRVEYVRKLKDEAKITQ